MKRSTGIILICLAIICGSLQPVIAQKKYVLSVVQPDPVSSPRLIDAGVDKEKRNVVRWNKEDNDFIDHYLIYKKKAGRIDKWKEVGNIPYSNDPLFIDTTDNTLLTAYAYSVSAVDRCGIETSLSNQYSSIKLSGFISNKDILQLEWTPLDGFPVADYLLCFGTTPDSLTSIIPVNSDITHYSLKYEEDTFFQIVAELDDDEKENYSGDLKKCSNIISSKQIILGDDSLNSLNVKYFPNPFTDEITIQFPNPQNILTKVLIWDCHGYLLVNEFIYGNDYKFTKGPLPAGVYLFQIIGKEEVKGKIIAK